MIAYMKLVGRKILEELKRQHNDVCSQVDAWEAEAKAACWGKPLDIKKRYVSASILPDNHVIFNLKGNKYRLEVRASYKNQIINIKRAGTHEEYMRW